jgi:hypothetical protein
MVPVGKYVGFIRAGHQKLFDIPVQGDGGLLTAIFHGTFHGVSDLSVFVRKGVGCTFGEYAPVGRDDADVN